MKVNRWRSEQATLPQRRSGAGVLRTLGFGSIFLLLTVGCSQKDATPASGTANETRAAEATGVTDADSAVTPVTTTANGPAMAGDPDVTYPKTTASVTQTDAVTKTGTTVINAWWFNTANEDYSTLADRLESERLITPEFAKQWRIQGTQKVENLKESTEIVRMWPARIATKNATFQISSRPANQQDAEETLTFLELVLVDGAWKVAEIQ